jgi:xanthine dehydrogenase accessory factor
MHRDLEVFQFIAERLDRDRPVMLLVVAESSGSSPGRRGYKMVVASDGELIGSIGGGLMEVTLVNQSRETLGTQAPSPASPHSGETDEDKSPTSFLKFQVHQKNSPNSSGMICSGRQTVIFKLLTPENIDAVRAAIDSLSKHRRDTLTVGPETFNVGPPEGGTQNAFQKLTDTEFLYRETLGPKDELYIVGGGHCALALSELASKLDFHVSLYDDRPNLNTLDKNRFAQEITIIDSYERIADRIPSSPNACVVVMTLGYKTDEIVIKNLLDKDFKYFGVLGSKAKMATLLKQLRSEGYSPEKLSRIHTPIGLPIHSRTPEEIAISIAAEIISIRNAD